MSISILGVTKADWVFWNDDLWEKNWKIQEPGLFEDPLRKNSLQIYWTQAPALSTLPGMNHFLNHGCHDYSPSVGPLVLAPVWIGQISACLVLQRKMKGFLEQKKISVSALLPSLPHLFTLQQNKQKEGISSTALYIVKIITSQLWNA